MRDSEVRNLALRPSQIFLSRHIWETFITHNVFFCALDEFGTSQRERQESRIPRIHISMNLTVAWAYLE
eukprot:6192871-Pleurochrysis_carterae.AAC.3